MSGEERTDGGARGDSAGEGLFDRTDGAIYGLPEHTQGRAVGARGVAPSRTLVLARVAAPRRASDAPAPAALRASIVLERVRTEPCDVLPPPEDGIPAARPRLAYAVDGTARRTAEVTSEVRRPPFMVESAAATSGPSAPPQPPRTDGVRTWVERLTRWWSGGA